MTDKTLAERFGPCTCRRGPDGEVIDRIDCPSCQAFQEWQHSPEILKVGDKIIGLLGDSS